MLNLLHYRNLVLGGLVTKYYLLNKISSTYILTLVKPLPLTKMAESRCTGYQCVRCRFLWFAEGGSDTNVMNVYVVAFRLWCGEGDAYRKRTAKDITDLDVVLNVFEEVTMEHR